jgi:large subunit ribosomal protein L25
MNQVSLSGSLRENVGKKDAREVRAQKRVPCVMYGGEDQIHFSIDLAEFSKYVYTPDVFKFELDLNGSKKEAILKDIQFDPVSDRIIHADFLEIVEGKALKMYLPVHIFGSSIGVKNGGRLLRNFRRIRVNGFPKDFPDAFDLNVDDLKIGDSIRIEHIETPDFEVMHKTESVIVGVRTARGAIEDEIEDEEDEEGE